LDAPDEAIVLYSVRVDSGIPADLAKELYDDAMRDINLLHDNQDEEEDGWLVTGRRAQIKTGFYIDGRKMYKKSAKVFLVINQLSVSLDRRVMVVRPNTGKRFQDDVYDKIHNKKWWKPCDSKTKVERALKIWKQEFDLADISSDEKYQFSCKGRHSNMMILTVGFAVA
jgi:hypothetical protein